jgi:Beta-lactamase enzyme family
MMFIPTQNKMKEDRVLSEKIKKVVDRLTPQPNQISVAVINLKKTNPEIAGYNLDTFIYPASIYKVFIGAEILKKISDKKISLTDTLEIKEINESNSEVVLFPKDSTRDSRPLLTSGDKVTIDYLLDLMLTRSDNTAANTLMDIAKREDINTDIILSNNWVGSDITRKFVDRLREEERYRKSDVTVSNTRHLAELFYKIEKRPC